MPNMDARERKEQHTQRRFAPASLNTATVAQSATTSKRRTNR